MSGTDTALQISPRILPRIVVPANRTAANRAVGNRVGNRTAARAGLGRAGYLLQDADAMLTEASRAIDDFAGGTRLGDSLAALRRRKAA